MTAITFLVPAVPVAQPRQRHRVLTAAGRMFAQNYTPAKHPVQDFKATVRMSAQAAYQGPPLEGPVTLKVLFVFRRPGRLCWKKRPMPRQSHASKPDWDNVGKSTVDALTGTLWGFAPKRPKRNDFRFVSGRFVLKRKGQMVVLYFRQLYT